MNYLMDALHRSSHDHQLPTHESSQFISLQIIRPISDFSRKLLGLQISTTFVDFVAPLSAFEFRMPVFSLN